MKVDVADIDTAVAELVETVWFTDDPTMQRDAHGLPVVDDETVEKHGDPGDKGYRAKHPGVSVSGPSRNRLEVKSPYNATFVSRVKSMGGKWKPEKKAWSVPADQADALEKLLDDAYGEKANSGVIKQADLPDKVSMSVKGGRLHVSAPYNESWRRDAYNMRGRWDPAAKAWTFDPADRERVTSAVKRAFGSSGSGHSPVRYEDSDAKVDRLSGLIAAGAWDDPNSKPPTQDEIDSMPAREVSSLLDRLSLTGTKVPKLATDRQVELLARLIAQGRWHDSDAGQYTSAPTVAEIRRMTSRDVSGFIDDLMDGGGW